MAADVYASISMTGRGGWTWYTGSSSWMYIAGFENILGIKKQDNILKINPCIPHNWSGFKVEYLYENTKYIIEIKNPNLKSNGLNSIWLDNKLLFTNEILLENDEKVHRIEVEF